MEKLTAFLARSFHEADEQKLAGLLRFLVTFETLGFVVQSAEPAEVHSVSEKVMRLIDECPIFIGIMTRRHPILAITPSWWTMGFTRVPENAMWTAPRWVLQELGYARKGGNAPSHARLTS